MASVSKYSQTVVSTGSWTGFTVANLNSDNSSYATTNSVTYVEGVLRNFDFQVPTGATIDGIVVSVDLSSSAANEDAYCRARISKNAGGDWSSYDTEVYTNSQVYHDFGGATDTWGLSLSDTEVNDNTNFYVQVDGRETATNRICQLDYVQVTVYYTEAGNDPIDVDISTSSSTSLVLSGKGELEVGISGSASTDMVLTGDGALNIGIAASSSTDLDLTAAALPGDIEVEINTSSSTDFELTGKGELLVVIDTSTGTSLELVGSGELAIIVNTSSSTDYDLKGKGELGVLINTSSLLSLTISGGTLDQSAFFFWWN